MTDDLSEIRPKSVPLSHRAETGDQQPQRNGPSPVVAVVAALAIVAVAGIVFWVIPGMVHSPEVVTRPVADPASADPQPARDGADSLPPFQQLLRQQARERAQAELARFVEMQMKLEENMQVGAWGQDRYDGVKDLASVGDELFLKEDFESAITSYQQAADGLAELISTGEQLFQQALGEGFDALNRRDVKMAVDRFDRALTINPDSVDAQHGRARADRLPEVDKLMRQAKNHQLAGEHRRALEVYEAVRDLDPDTHGLSQEIHSARQGLQRDQINAHLSRGFEALNGNRLAAAREAFNAALALDPGNAVAAGGLEQVADRDVSARLDGLRRAAARAEQAEDWQKALDSYQAVLASDSTIQFARDGRQRATVQLRVARGLANIIAAPEKLSSASLYAQAEKLLDEARSLAPRGVRLGAQIDAVSALIEAYRHPIAVTFVSDNATQVTVSTIGKLGSFERKEVSLRPGAYTVIGSRDGCRDIRENIVVRPNMAPVDIRCLERL